MAVSIRKDAEHYKNRIERLVTTWTRILRKAFYGTLAAQGAVAIYYILINVLLLLGDAGSYVLECDPNSLQQRLADDGQIAPGLVKSCDEIPSIRLNSFSQQIQQMVAFYFIVGMVGLLMLGYSHLKIAHGKEAHTSNGKIHVPMHFGNIMFVVAILSLGYHLSSDLDKAKTQGELLTGLYNANAFAISKAEGTAYVPMVTDQHRITPMIFYSLLFMFCWALVYAFMMIYSLIEWETNPRLMAISKNSMNGVMLEVKKQSASEMA